MAWLGDVNAAIESSERADMKEAEPETLIAWTATVGLLDYRAGSTATGRAYYEAAIDAALRRSIPAMAAIAGLNWALIAYDCDDLMADDISTRALALSERLEEPAILSFRQRLLARRSQQNRNRLSAMP